MLALLKAYQKRLTNLTASNKSLLLLTLPAEQFLDLHELDYLDGRPSFDTVRQLVAGKARIPLCAQLDSRYDKVNEAAKRLGRVARTAAFIEQERGAQDLYVGYPTVRGAFLDGTPVRCPLLFFPVALVPDGNRWWLQPRDTEPVQFNRSFLLAYAHFNQVKLSDDWLETSFDDFSRDSLAFRTELYEHLKKSPLEINFNPETFADALQPFKTFKKSDFEAGQRTGEIKLFPEAVLGIFPQAGSYLMPDYEHLIAGNQYASLDELFGGADEDPPADGDSGPQGNARETAESLLLTPLPLDASQEQAVRLVSQGRSVVVQGPPGTGKSQFIANLTAHYAARGKRVLLVCQKRAALDVVHERLARLGMADFLALVHDHKQDRKPIYEQLNRQIERLDEYKRLNQSLDAIQADRAFAQECRRIDKLAAELDAFRAALFDAAACGLSVKDLYLTSRPQGARIALKKEYKHFHFNRADDFIRRLAALHAYRALDAPGHPWASRVSFHAFTHTDLDRLAGVLAEVPHTARSVEAQAARIAGFPVAVADLETLSSEGGPLRRLLSLLADAPLWPVFLAHQTGEHAHVTAGWLDKHEKQALKCFRGEGIEKNTSEANLSVRLAQCQRALKARRNPLAWWRWRLLAREGVYVRQVAAANHLALSLPDLQRLVERLRRRTALEKVLDHLHPLGYAVDFKDEAALKHWFAVQKAARRGWRLTRKLTSWAWLQRLVAAGGTGFQQKMHQLLAVADEWEQARAGWKLWLTEPQVAACRHDAGAAARLAASLADDFDRLAELDAIKHGLLPHERDVVARIQAQDDHAKANWTEVFDNSLRLAWIEHIETEQPLLRAASTHRLRQTEADLQAAVQQKQTLSRQILLMQLREQTYRHVAYNRLQNRTTYRDLQHQVTKKRHVWSLRKLLAHHADEVFRLAPCWMASPESVSALFGMDGADGPLFDLVVFDEASQCFAERGLPAMHRGRQVVVAGDSKQLPPSDLYQIRYEEAADDQPELEVNSLLDLAVRYLPQTHLRGHYRSQSLALIDFSNRHFYGQSLEMLPDFRRINEAEPAIRYLKTDGLWHEGCNRPEAEAVAALVERLLAEKPGQSVGVVTFNFKQQALVQDLIETAALEAGRLLPPDLFVKNIENVQGDERDIIVFSIGYAPDTAGRLVMQFGSLNLPGGENRLNVAVTRAREQVYVVSSLHPQQVRTENALHAGPHLLRQYLEYAWQVSAGQYVPQPRPKGRFAGTVLLKERLLAQPAHPLLDADRARPTEELPFADLTLKHQGRYEGLLLTDDDLYYQSLSAKEAHVYTPLLLQAKHWRFRRVYSREWWKTPPQEPPPPET